MTSYEKNPYIARICHQLVAQKFDLDELEPENVTQLVDSLYTRFESKLGRNIVESLPQEQREAFKKQMAGLGLDKDSKAMDKMASMFENMDMSGIDFGGLMKYTLTELSDEFLKS